MLISVVDRKRYGLFEHSQALVNFYLKADENNRGVNLFRSKASISGSKRFSLMAFFYLLYQNRISTIVLWSVGVSYLILPLINIIFPQVKIIVVIHEPGGITQRFKKGDSFFYSIVLSIYELCLIFSKVTRVTPNKKNALIYNFLYAPLLLDEILPSNNVKKDSVVYLGRKSNLRSLELFKLLKNEKPLSDINFTFFPNNKNSTEDKALLMERSICTLNLYTVPHNQSGVTVDSLRFGVPVIVTDLDAFCNLVLDKKAGVVIPVNKLSLELVMEEIFSIKKSFESYSNSAHQLYEQEFGYIAFEAYWLHIL